jgi:hypothetical protein
MQLKHILFLMIGSYLFSLGMFSDHVYHRVQLNKIFQTELRTLNILNAEKNESLTLLKQDLQHDYQGLPVVSHIEALIQKNPKNYQYENVLIVNSEQIQLQEFYLNFITNISHYFPNSASLAQSLIILELKIIEQRNKTLSALSKTLN